MKIYLSPPHLAGTELDLVREVFASNWIAPVGSQLDAFEQECAELIGSPAAVALSSGTAALHLALRVLGIQPGDEVLCSSFTFCASANPIVHERAQPVFLDAERRSWNMDPNLLEEELTGAAARGRLPRAVIVADIYGQCADYDRILALCSAYQIPVIEDAAEALGATYRGRMAGTLGHLGVFSFNGNKIITTSGGGMLVGHDPTLTGRARFLATQAREPTPHYQHSVSGYNYRLSNVLAAIGRGQLRVLGERIAARRHNFECYRSALGHLPGISFQPIADYGRPNYWLTCLVIDPEAFGATREEVRLALASESIESRPLWMPLHRQPAFANCRYRGGAVSEELFARGLCLPSGSNLSEADRSRVTEVILSLYERGPLEHRCRSRSAPTVLSKSNVANTCSQSETAS